MNKNFQKDRLTASISENTNSINQLETDVEGINSSLTQAHLQNCSFSCCYTMYSIHEFLTRLKFLNLFLDRKFVE